MSSWSCISRRCSCRPASVMYSSADWVQAIVSSSPKRVMMDCSWERAAAKS
ncbi:hypothetical protein [Actinacidiphila soli]|uniref:hypothetical protein n=1 Tax=Actinacidiphila soli TaxID=2487275 RepID=UPI0013E3D3D7|nr:hypothetical protein [Actinacidiphila soli]